MYLDTPLRCASEMAEEEQKIISLEEERKKRNKVRGGISPTGEGLSDQLVEHVGSNTSPGEVSVRVKKGRFVWKRTR